MSCFFLQTLIFNLRLWKFLFSNRCKSIIFVHRSTTSCSIIIIIIIIIIFITTFVQGIYNCIPRTNHVSKVYSVSTILYSQFILHVMLIRTWNMVCTFLLVRFIIIIIIIIIIIDMMGWMGRRVKMEWCTSLSGGFFWLKARPIWDTVRSKCCLSKESSIISGHIVSRWLWLSVPAIRYRHVTAVCIFYL